VDQCTVLAFDIGAGNGRGIVGRYSREKGFESMQEIYRFENGYVRINGSLYWDYLRIYRGMLDAISKCKQAGIHLDAIGVDAWAQDFAYISQGGEVLGLPRSYRDPVNQERGKNFIHDMFLEDIDIAHRSGTGNGAILTLNQLYNDRVHRKDLFTNAKYFLFMPYLMIYLLSGEACFDITMPSIGGLCDARTMDVSLNTLNLLGVADKLPRRCRRGEIIGYTCKSVCEETMTEPIPIICTDAHDTSSAASSIPDGGEFLWVSSGTFNMYGAVLKDAPRLERLWEMGFSDTLLGDGRACVMGGGGAGMYHIQQCMKLWKHQGLSISYPMLTEYAISHFTDKRFDFKQISDTALDMFADINASIEGAGFAPAQTPFELYEVFCNSLAAMNAFRLRQLELEMNRYFDRVYIIGGGSQADGINIRMAKLMNRPILVGLPEASAIGNMLAQFEGLGAYIGHYGLADAERNGKMNGLMTMRRFEP
jgi:rhamnulokinase